ncbi:MAG: hypothetical protein U0P30_01265 [Vicinamibacterales bacterium]
MRTTSPERSRASVSCTSCACRAADSSSSRTDAWLACRLRYDSTTRNTSLATVKRSCARWASMACREARSAAAFEVAPRRFSSGMVVVTDTLDGKRGFTVKPPKAGSSDFSWKLRSSAS